MPLQCCKTCGRDTKNKNGICAACIDLDSARQHTEDEIIEDEDDDNFFDRDIDYAIRDALDLD
jgi:hypothetical protein